VKWNMTFEESKETHWSGLGVVVEHAAVTAEAVEDGEGEAEGTGVEDGTGVSVGSHCILLTRSSKSRTKT
jgi:hypothetical protein